MVCGLCWWEKINISSIQTLRLIRQIKTSPSAVPQGSPALPSSPKTSALRALPSRTAGWEGSGGLATKTCVHRIESEREGGSRAVLGSVPGRKAKAWRAAQAAAWRVVRVGSEVPGSLLPRRGGSSPG